MKQTFTTLLLGAIFTLAVNTAFGQSVPTSVGPAPQTTQNQNNLRQGGPVQTTNVNSRGWVYLNPAWTLNRQFMGNTTVTPVGTAQAITFPGATAWNSSTQRMYIINQSSPFQMYTVDTTTGVWTFVANCTGVPHTNFTGITWDPTTSTMYGVSSSITASQIFTINLVTGVCTPIGIPTTVCAGAIQVNASPTGSLYSVDIVADNLYKWNKVTGVATLVGPLGVNANFGQDGHFDNSDGQYYWAAYTTGPQLRIIDTLTGASTLVGTYASQAATLAIRNNPPCINTTFTQTLSGCTGFSVTVGTSTYNTTGTYTNILVNSGGCDSTVTTNLTINPFPTVTATASPATICVGQTSTLTGGGAATYSWMPGNLTGTSVPVTPVTATTYTMSGTSAAGCTSTTTVTVAVNANPIVTATASANTICSGGSSTLTAINASPAPTYCQPTYASGTQFGDYISSVVCNTLNNTTGASASPYYTLYPATSPTTTTLVAGGTYTITLVCGTFTVNDIAAFIDYNQNGTLNNGGEKLGETDNMPAMPASTSFTFTVPLTALNGTTRLRVREMDHGGTNDIDPCLTQSTWGETEDYIITITGGVDPLTYAWGPATFLSATTGSPVNATLVNATTTYTVTATNLNGCTATDTAIVNVNALPNVTATSAIGTICDGSNDTITAGGASTYVWDNTATTTTIVVTPNTTTTYTVTGTDANGCVNTATATVTVNALPVVTASSTIGTVCDGSNDTLVAGGASSYVWDNSSTNDSIVVAPNTTTTYTVTGTDANGCVNTATATVTVNALPTVTATSFIGTICDGSSDTLVAGGASTYVWDNTATTDTIVVAPNATTTYTVTGTDANGCVNTATATVTVNALPVVTLTLGQDTACQSAGTITLNGETPAGGTWSGTAVTGNTFDPIVSGVGMFGITYMYTDVNGCSSSAVDSIMVDICSAIATSSNTNGVVVFPNPNDGQFTIQLSAAPVAPVQVEVINELGQVVIAFTMVGTTKEVDMNDLSAGAYFVRTINGDVINVQRIMKK